LIGPELYGHVDVYLAQSWIIMLHTSKIQVSLFYFSCALVAGDDVG